MKGYVMATQNDSNSVIEQYGAQTINYACTGFVETFGFGDGMDGAELEFTSKELAHLYLGLSYLKAAAEYYSEVGRKLTNKEVLESLDWIGSRAATSPDAKAIEALQARLYKVMQFDDLVTCTLLFLPLDAAIIPHVGHFWLSIPLPPGQALAPDLEQVCEKLIDSAYCGIETDLDDYSFVQRLILASGPVGQASLPRH
jgi:hypothetical protein